MAPARDAPVEDIEDQRGDDEEGRPVHFLGARLANVLHGQEDRRHPACTVGQGEEVGQVKVANH